MAIGPRLDLRHSQSLVMTPQLRQAIKLLQFSNLEVSLPIVEEELERNPLLERDDRSGGAEPDAPRPRSAAGVAMTNHEADVADLVSAPTALEDAALPRRSISAIRSMPPMPAFRATPRPVRSPCAGRHAKFRRPTTARIDDLVQTKRRSLRDDLAEQLRLNVHRPHRTADRRAT